MYLFCIFLYFLQDDADDHDCKLDLEDVLDLDTDSERRQYAIVSIQLSCLLNSSLTRVIFQNLFYLSADFFPNLTFSKKYFRTTIRMTNSLDPDWSGSKLFAKLSTDITS